MNGGLLARNLTVSVKSAEAFENDRPIDASTVGFSNLTLGANVGQNLTRMHNMSVGVITYRNASSVEEHLRERTKRRNQAMKR